MSRFLGIGLHPEYFSIVSADENRLESIALLELSRPFDLNYLREGDWSVQYYIETLITLLEKIGEHGNKAGLVLNSSMVLLKKTPAAMGLEKELIEDQLRWEAEQMLVSSVDQYNLVFDRLPFSAPTGNPYYIQVLVRKKVLETARRLLSEAGLTVSDVDVDCFSIIRTLQKNYPLDPQNLVVVIDLHLEYVGLVFIRKGEYFLSTRLFIKDTPEESSDLVKFVLKDLRRIVFGHGLGKGLEDIQGFFVLDHVGRKDFVGLFSEASGVVADAIQPFQKLPVSDDLKKSAEYEVFPERFTTAVGAVLKRYPTLSQ
jgi:hypothetical protein